MMNGIGANGAAIRRGSFLLKYARRLHAWVAILVLLLIVPAGDADPKVGGQNEKGFFNHPLTFDQAVESALNRSMERLESVSRLSTQGLYMLQTAQDVESEIEFDRNLRSYLEGVMPEHRLDPYLRIADKTLPRPELPQELGSGVSRLGVFLMASIGVPDNRAIEHLRTFLGEEHSAYGLTHQYLVLEWYEKDGRKLPPDLKGAKKRMLRRIYEEQRAAGEDFSDLYAERVHLLMAHHNELNWADARDWVRVILGSQEESGDWGEQSWDATFDGETIPVRGEVIHTHVMCVSALRHYLDRFYSIELE
ncbi:MAG: hypothetical protein AAGD22_06130 [Verrucomicrobiota bacterium]